MKEVIFGLIIGWIIGTLLFMKIEDQKHKDISNSISHMKMLQTSATYYIQATNGRWKK